MILNASVLGSIMSMYGLTIEHGLQNQKGATMCQKKKKQGPSNAGVLLLY